MGDHGTQPGSIIVVAAIVGAHTGAGSAVPIDLVTFGSPLRKLYAKAFRTTSTTSWSAAFWRGCPGRQLD